MMTVKASGPNFSLRRRNYLVIRALDLLLASMVLIFVGPLLLLITILKLSCDKSPIFYNSKRVGLDGGRLKVFKFRTMINDSNIISKYIRNLNRSGFEAIPLDAPIYTKLGRAFEKFQIVEIPQFVNVIIGNMSLVGYRPLPESLVAELQVEFGKVEVSRRHARIPGITGWAQLSGKGHITNRQRIYLENSLNDFLINESSSVKLIAVYITLILDTVFFIVLKRTFFLNIHLRKLGIKQ